MAKVIPIALLNHYNSGATTVCTCWKVVLVSGITLGFTDHDQDVLFGGVNYLAATGYTASAIDSTSELNPDNLSLDGFLQSPAITEGDLHSGKWDFAYVEIFQVNYMDVSMGRDILRAGFLGQVQSGRSKFTVELRGLMQMYAKTIVRLMAKECNADLGDDRCKLDLTPFTYGPMTVDSVSADFRTIQSSGLSAYADGWFTGGVVYWQSGANAGLNQEVQYSAQGVAQINLFQQPPFQPVVGDRFTIIAGCTKRFQEDCLTKFNNVPNFRGFPHLPQADAYKVGTNNGAV
jgi:uncharacterized phage protein (TIGR02218 family)